MNKEMKKSMKISFSIVGVIAALVLVIFVIAHAISGYTFSPAVTEFLKAPITEMTRYELYIVAIAAGLIFGS